MAEETEDEELAAIKTVLNVLTPLKTDARNNVIEYVFRRLGMTAPAAASPAAPPPAATLAAPPSHPSPHGAPTLLSLTEQKKPRSANQMVAVLAYYLAHHAPADQRRNYVVADDIQKYFLQANFELPTGPPSMTLVNAKNAGYLDVISAGQYRLNPVGHNLVTHKLPRAEGAAPGGGARRLKRAKKRKKKAKK
jgi:hypothetical protein